MTLAYPVLVRIGLVASLLVSASCSSMLESTYIDASNPSTCLNSAGAYFLPKKLIKVVIKGDKKKGSYGLDLDNELISVPDASEPYCLDYLASPTSRDEIGIIRTPEGLLQRVYTRAEDKSGEIVKRLIDTSFLLAGAGGREFVGEFTGTEEGNFTFDPFDPWDAARINAALRVFGYCVFVEGYTFPSNVSPQSWCERPQVATGGPTKAAYKVEPLPPPSVALRGVLYRPNVAQRLTIMQRTGVSKWSLVMTRQIEVPNRAPVFVAEVNRSLFVDRVTDLEFSNGVLTNISVTKPSELAVMVEIPLRVASAAVALPGLIVKLKINDANNEARLIRANTELIAVRRQHADSLAAYMQKYGGGSSGAASTTLPPPGAETGNRAGEAPVDRAELMQRCMGTGKPEHVCEQQLRDIAR